MQCIERISLIIIIIEIMCSQMCSLYEQTKKHIIIALIAYMISTVTVTSIVYQQHIIDSGNPGVYIGPGVLYLPKCEVKFTSSNHLLVYDINFNPYLDALQRVQTIVKNRSNDRSNDILSNMVDELGEELYLTLKHSRKHTHICSNVDNIVHITRIPVISTILNNTTGYEYNETLLTLVNILEQDIDRLKSALNLSYKGYLSQYIIRMDRLKKDLNISTICWPNILHMYNLPQLVVVTNLKIDGTFDGTFRFHVKIPTCIYPDYTFMLYQMQPWFRDDIYIYPIINKEYLAVGLSFRSELSSKRTLTVKNIQDCYYNTYCDTLYCPIDEGFHSQLSCSSALYLHNYDLIKRICKFYHDTRQHHPTQCIKISVGWLCVNVAVSVKVMCEKGLESVIIMKQADYHIIKLTTEDNCVIIIDDASEYDDIPDDIPIQTLSPPSPDLPLSSLSSLILSSSSPIIVDSVTSYNYSNAVVNFLKSMPELLYLGKAGSQYYLHHLWENINENNNKKVNESNESGNNKKDIKKSIFDTIFDIKTIVLLTLLVISFVIILVLAIVFCVMHRSNTQHRSNTDSQSLQLFTSATISPPVPSISLLPPHPPLPLPRQPPSPLHSSHTSHAYETVGTSHYNTTHDSIYHRREHRPTRYNRYGGYMHMHGNSTYHLGEYTTMYDGHVTV